MQFRIYHSSGVPLALALHCCASLKSFRFYSAFSVSDINRLFFTTFATVADVFHLYTRTPEYGDGGMTEILQCTRRSPLLVA
jgi:hypothetical protein